MLQVYVSFSFRSDPLSCQCKAEQRPEMRLPYLFERQIPPLHICKKNSLVHFCWGVDVHNTFPVNRLFFENNNDLRVARILLISSVHLLSCLSCFKPFKNHFYRITRQLGPPLKTIKPRTFFVFQVHCIWTSPKTYEVF